MPPVAEREFHSAWMTDEGAVGGAAGAATALFPWWSFTKTALAIAALRLVGQECLHLDGALPGKAFSLRQLLTHRAGVPDYGGIDAYHRAVSRREDAWSRATLLEAAGADQLLFEPGAPGTPPRARLPGSADDCHRCRGAVRRARASG